LVAFTAAIANAFAITLQAAEARRSPDGTTARLALFSWLLRRPQWLLGTGLLILAWPLQVLALAWAPITVVQPILASFQLVLLVLARQRLRERVGRTEVLAALSIAAGLVIVVAAAPRHSFTEPGSLRLAIPLTVVALAAVLAYVTYRIRAPGAWLLVVGAGLGYAWVDFADKLLSNSLSAGRWPTAALWMIGILGLGGLAFLQENSALQRRPAVSVGPVIGAIQEPLPVLMALWTGAESWSSDPTTIAALLAGLALVAAGATVLGRSRAVAGVTGSPAEPHGAAPVAA
jgi:hypothetical protein